MAASKVKRCIICFERPAEVPNRDSVGRPIKEVCSICHKQRLLKDLQRVVAEYEEEKRREKYGS
jgi:hypothetical protein